MVSRHCLKICLAFYAVESRSVSAKADKVFNIIIKHVKIIGRNHAKSIGIVEKGKFLHRIVKNVFAEQKFIAVDAKLIKQSCA